MKNSHSVYLPGVAVLFSLAFGRINDFLLRSLFLLFLRLFSILKIRLIVNAGSCIALGAFQEFIL